MKKEAEEILEQADSSLRQWQSFSGLSSDQFAPSWISWWFDLFGFICYISWLLLFSCITLYYSVLFCICVLYYSLTLYSYLLLFYLAFFFQTLNCQPFHPFEVLRIFCSLRFWGLFSLGAFVCFFFPPPLIAKIQFITGGSVSISQLAFFPK